MRGHWPWTFHLCNTLPHPSSSPLGDSSQLTEGKARPTTVLLLSYSKQGLPLSCIPRHHKSTLCISPTSPAFLCQPSFCGVPLTMYQWCYGHFSLVGLMPYSSSLLATGILRQCCTTCMSSPIQSCQDFPNSFWLVAIPSSLRKPPACPYPTHPYLWANGVPEPLP